MGNNRNYLTRFSSALQGAAQDGLLKIKKLSGWKTNFGTMFDGYCVGHAPFVSPDRKKWFEKELKRVGINNYTVIEAARVDNSDKRMEYFKHRKFKGRVRGQISCADMHKKCIDFAKRRGWKNVVLLEDDIVFRDKFEKWWPEVENEVKQYNWDILFLYRWTYPPIYEPTTKTKLVPIQKTVCLHCLVVREEFYSTYQDAIDYSLQRGLPCDADRVFNYLRKRGCRVFATNKNLAGQKGGLTSGIAADRVTGSDLRGQFHVRGK